MITSNINAIRATFQDTVTSTQNNTLTSFISTLVTNKEVSNTSKTDVLTYENIKGITLKDRDIIINPKIITSAPN